MLSLSESFHELGIRGSFLGVLKIRALLFGVCIRAPIFGNSQVSFNVGSHLPLGLPHEQPWAREEVIPLRLLGGRSGANKQFQPLLSAVA